MATNSVEFVAEFIKLYRGFPCLWDKSDPQYGSKNNNCKLTRENAYNVLLNKFREYDPTANKANVLNKINNLRTAHNKEYKKVLKSELLGDTIYKPSLWYYDLFDFLREHKYACETFNDDSNFNGSNFNDSMMGNPNDNGSSDEDVKGNFMMMDEEQTDSMHEPDITIDEIPIQHHPLLGKRKMQSCPTPSKVQLITKRPESCKKEKESTNSLFGKYIVNELDNMSPEMIPYVKKLISEVIFEGHMETLNRSSTISTSS